VGLPTTLADIGIPDASDEDLRIVAEAACGEGETIHHEPWPVNAGDSRRGRLADRRPLRAQPTQVRQRQRDHCVRLAGFVASLREELCLNLRGRAATESSFRDPRTELSGRRRRQTQAAKGTLAVEFFETAGDKHERSHHLRLTER
jgi:hypothetical protein